MRVVIDTNVLVSAVLKDKIPEKIILFIVKEPDFEWIVTEKILREYKDVLSRSKFNLPSDLVKQWGLLIARSTVMIKAEVKVDLPRDQKDAPFLECCVSSGADFLITGDRDFKGAQKLVNTKIVSVSQFKRLVCDTL